MKSAIKLENIRKEFNEFKLGPLNLEIKKGYITGFIGVNGSGKTTTIKLIMNLIKSDSGLISFGDKEMISDEVFIKNKIGFLYDEVGYYEMLRVNQMAKIIAGFYEEWDWKLFQYYINKFKINDNEKILNLSRGTKVKFSIAIALSHNAEILIFDEPTSGLDPIARDEMMEIFQEIIMDKSKSIFLSSHITEDLEKIADYIVFINQGKIVLSGEKDKIVNEHFLVKGIEEEDFYKIKDGLIYKNDGKYGLECLCKISGEDTFFIEDSVVLDKATLKDIMLGYIKGGKDCE